MSGHEHEWETSDHGPQDDPKLGPIYVEELYCMRCNRIKVDTYVLHDTEEWDE